MGKLSNQLKAKLIGAKANLTAFLMKNNKDVKNKEGRESSEETDQNKNESSTSYESQTQVANLAATTNETSTNTKSSKEHKLVGFMTTAETASKNVLDNALDAFKRATSKRRVSIFTEDLKSDGNKKQFEEEQKETDKEETPVVEN